MASSPGVVIGAVEAHHAVLQHLEQLVHLHGVHLADLVEKKHAAVGARDRAFLGLRHAALPQRAGPLIDGVVDAAEERVGDGALVKAQAGGVHLDKGRVARQRGVPSERLAASSASRAAQVLPTPGGP